MKCEYVEEIVEGKDYRYCDNPASAKIGGNTFCVVHLSYAVVEVIEDSPETIGL